MTSHKKVRRHISHMLLFLTHVRSAACKRDRPISCYVYQTRTYVHTSATCECESQLELIYLQNVFIIFFSPGGMNVANVGNMVVTNSNMTGPNMLGGGIINNVNKQLPTLMGNNHHGTPPHHPHAQVSSRIVRKLGRR